MYRFFSTLLLAFALLTQPARAELAQFEYAFTEVCFKNLPDLSDTPRGFLGKNWQGSPGADRWEYEFYSGTTSVFLYAVDAPKNPTCTVMDEQVPMLAAEWLLELALDKHFAGAWQKAKGYNDQPVWHLKIDDTTTEFYINEGLGGGAAISLSVQS